MNRQDTKDAKEEVRSEPGAELDRLAHRVIGAALEVHRTLGPGFLEAIYEEALCVELSLRRIPFARQVPIGVDYKGNLVGQARLDLVVDGQLVVELKASECIAPIHVAQLLSYLKAARLRLGLLITFKVSFLRTGVKRVVHSP
ncbi:GxxExxY protein [Sorangium sp. So ce426]|uniref:GxxExxY protein n=1 Tax=unclassified Sorangium TaxID=2621164 RepID=UPI003F5B3566